MDDIAFDKSRIIGFSDAIFSIAMTLLILEIAVPNGESVNEYGTWKILEARIPSFIGLVVSFLVTAIYWVAHLRLMKYVTVIDSKLLWLNIFLLLFVVLLPFSTAFYVGSFFLTGPYVFYCINLAVIGLFNYLMIRYVVKKEKGETGLKGILSTWHKARALNGMLIWVISGMLAFIFPVFSRFVFVFLFLIIFFLNKYYSRKLNCSK